eukprot:4783661-Prymnesium_polylepis.1
MEPRLCFGSVRRNKRTRPVTTCAPRRVLVAPSTEGGRAETFMPCFGCGFLQTESRLARRRVRERAAGAAASPHRLPWLG